MSLADQIIEHGPWKPGTIGLELLADTSGALIIPEAVNELRDELIAARALKELLASGRYMAYATPARDAESAMLGISHEDCPSRWFTEVEDFGELAELVHRAGEHGEVCR